MCPASARYLTPNSSRKFCNADEELRVARQHQSSCVIVGVNDTHHPSSSHSRAHNDPLLVPPWPQLLARDKARPAMSEKGPTLAAGCLKYREKVRVARQDQSSFVIIAVNGTHHPSSSHSRPHNDPLLAPPWLQPLAQERSLGRSLRQEAPQGGGREGACSIIAQARLQARRRVAGGACRGAQARASASAGGHFPH